MKIDFDVNCANPAIVWAVKEALEARGFRVTGCGFMVASNEPDLQCEPPIDFADAVPDVVMGVAMGPK